MIHIQYYLTGISRREFVVVYCNTTLYFAIHPKYKVGANTSPLSHALNIEVFLINYLHPCIFCYHSIMN